MAFIRDVAVTEFTATGTTGGTADMPVHESGDIILLFASKDATGAITQTGAVYTSLQSGASAGAWGGAWWLRAASANEAGFVGTWTADTAVMVAVSIGGVHATNAPTSVRDAADDSTIPYTTTGTLNTPSANCLIVASCHADAVQGPTPWPTDLQVLYAGDSGEAGLGVGWTFEPGSGVSCTGKRFFGGTADDVRCITVCIEDISGGSTTRNAYVDPTSTAPTFLTPLTGAALSVDGRSWSLPGTVTVPMLGRNVGTYFNHDGTTFTDDTTDINDVGTADVNPTNTTSGVIYFGDSAQFSALTIAVSTAGTGSPASVWEYWNGSAWATLSLSSGVAGDLNFTATGNKTFRFKPPADWATTTVNSVSAYWVRRRQTANWTVAAVLSQACLDGIGNLFDTVAATADSGVNPYHTSNALSGPATTPDTNQIVGNEYLSGTAIDMDPGYLLTQLRYVAPRDGIDVGLMGKHKGISFGVFDTSNNYKMWTVAGKDARDSNYTDKIVCGLQPAQATDTTWAKLGSLNAASIDTVYMAATSAFGAVAAQFSQLLLVNGSTIISGGTSTTPIEFDDITGALVKGCGLFPVVKADGKAATFYVPLQMGGADQANISCSLSTFQFPTQASLAAKRGTWHVDDNVIGIEFYGLSGELREFLGCTFVSDSAYYWRFNASHSASSTTDFTGSTVVKANVTLQSTVTLDSVTFQNCPTFALNSAVLSNCTFKDTKVSAATPADAADITDSAFVSSGTGHGIEISGTAANISLDGVTFTGYAASNGSTGNEAIYVNIASGTMTISIIGGGSTPSIRTAGATVTVQNAVTVKVTAKDADTAAAIQSARVLLQAASGTTVTITRSGSTATVAHTAHGKTTGDKVVIAGANQGEYNKLATITVTNANEYTYSVSGTPATPATGTITSSRVILDDATDASGIVQTTAFNYTSDLAVSGRVRKGSAATYYKTSPLSGTITAAGLDLTSFLVKDT